MFQAVASNPPDGKRRIADDLCPSLEHASEYTGEPVRRIRYLIAKYDFPMKKNGGRHQGFYSAIDRWYAERLGSPQNGS